MPRAKGKGLQDAEKSGFVSGH
ncbi:MAG: hypothetical protein QOE55_4448, partial [Acidobacteriaceae bacterium]|nr:hypothetical protein [Acidobacteriaceae bacterium]